MAKVPRQAIQEHESEVEDDNLDEQDEQGEDTSQVDAEFAKASDVNTLKEQLSSIRNLLERSPAPQPTQPTPRTRAAIEDVTDEELDEIIASGGAGASKKLRKAINAGVERRVRDLEEQLEQLNLRGTNAIGNVVERLAKSDLKYLEHPKIGPLIKKAQQEAIAYSPEIKTDLNVLKKIHDMVVGENYEVLVQEAQEEATRKARQKESSLPTDNTGRTVKGKGNETPTPKDLLGIDMTLDEADEYAKRTLGYKDGWAAYAKVIAKQNEEGARH